MPALAISTKPRSFTATVQSPGLSSIAFPSSHLQANSTANKAPIFPNTELSLPHHVGWLPCVTQRCPINHFLWDANNPARCKKPQLTTPFRFTLYINTGYHHNMNTVNPIWTQCEQNIGNKGKEDDRQHHLLIYSEQKTEKAQKLSPMYYTHVPLPSQKLEIK